MTGSWRGCIHCRGLGPRSCLCLSLGSKCDDILCKLGCSIQGLEKGRHDSYFFATPQHYPQAVVSKQTPALHLYFQHEYIKKIKATGGLTALLWLLFRAFFQFKLGENPDLRFRLIKRKTITRRLATLSIPERNYCFACARNARLTVTHLCLSTPGKWQLCHHQPGGRMSTRKWWSCGPDSLHPPRALGQKSAGRAGESWASWPPTEKKIRRETQSSQFWTDVHADRRVSATHSYLLLSLLGKRKLALTAHVARKLLIGLGVSFTAGCEDEIKLHKQHDRLHERRAIMELSIWVCKSETVIKQTWSNKCNGRTQQRNTTKKPGRTSLAANKRNYLLSPRSTASLKTYLFHTDFR